MKRQFAIRHLVAVSLLAGLGTAVAFRAPDHEELPNFDKRQPAEVSAAERSAKAAHAWNLGARVRGFKLDTDPLFGVPKWVGSTEEFLTGPGGVGRAVAPGSAARFAAGDPHRAIKAFVHEHAPLFGHGAEALEQARVERDYVTAHNGMRTVVWQQQLDGIAVFGARFIGHVTKDGELVNVASQFVPDLNGAPARSLGNRAARLNSPAVSPAQAIAIAGRNLGEPSDAAELRAVDAPTGVERRQKFTGGNLIGESDARLTYFPASRDALRLGWDVIATRHEGGEMYRIVVDAETGEVLLRHCLTAHLTNASFRVYTSDSPSPFSPGHATPSTGQPTNVPQVLLTLPALDTNASPLGWINDTNNQTLGNNVDAHLDRNNDNQPDLPRPQGSPFRVFDFTNDLAIAPTNAVNQNFGVVQLFYLNNWIHDRLYQLGFTEAAGNFQTTNFGRGGVGNDAVQADAQDGGGFNNANFGTPPDGSPGRMQMYLFNGPNPDRDGDLDSEIVIHEYGHGLSNRRVGGGVGISALQSAGMGEGWSDWYALALLAEPGDDLSGNYAAGGYATFQLGGLTQNYYYGIRRYPYSTNLSINPLTFKDIDPTQADPHAGIPRSPIIGNSATEVHNQGEVWCVALWEVRVNLVLKHGFAIGNELALRLVTDGMGLSPANPNFLQARDGIVQADLVLTGGANQNEIWAGFAKRGMGFSATSPASSTTTGVVESYDLPDALRITPSSGLVMAGPVGGPFNPSNKVYVLTNLTTSNLVWTAGVGSNWLSVSSGGTTLPAGGAVTNFTVSVNSNAAPLPAGVFTNILRFTNQTSGRIQTRSFVLAIGQPDTFTEVFDALDVDVANNTFIFTPDGSASRYTLCRRSASAFPTDPAGGTTVTLSDDSFVQVTLGGGASVPFFGTNRTAFFIGSNGYITFGSGDVEYAESTAVHFNRARISAFFCDLNPSLGGTISWQQFGDRVVVTWQNLREFGTTRQNSFQIEMFFNGIITVTHLTLQSQHALVGLSRGGGAPAVFTESDLTSYPICLPPLFVFAPATTNEGAGVLTNAGRVVLGSPLTNNVVVNVASSATNEIIVPPTVMILAGQTTNFFNLTVVDDAVVDGPRPALITATSPGFPPASTTVIVNDNEPVALSVIMPASTFENAGVLVTQGVVRASLPPVNNVTVALTSSNTARLQVPATVTLPTGQTSAVFNLAIVDNAIADGAAIVGVTARVNNWTNGVGTITIFDDEAGAGGVLERFELGPVANTQFVGVPFSLSVTAIGPANLVASNFNGVATVRGHKRVGGGGTVRVVAYVGAGISEFYPNVLSGISNYFTNFTVTNITTTNSAQIVAALANADVFLVPELPIEAVDFDLAPVVSAYAPALRDFMYRGGTVIASSTGYGEYTFLTATAVLSADRVTGNGNSLLTLVTNVLTAGLPATFGDTDVSYFVVSTNAQHLVVEQGTAYVIAAARDFGLGRGVLLGCGFHSPGTQFELILANAVRAAGSNVYDRISMTPAFTGLFVNGLWPGSIEILEPASNAVLTVFDNGGHFGLSSFFSVIGNAVPVASNLSVTMPGNTFTNLLLSGFDPEGSPLTYALASAPVSGLALQTISNGNAFRYTPAHGFAGGDAFTFTVNDGLTSSSPATVNISVLALLDTDGDQMPDTWEVAHGLNPIVKDGDEDPDSDGLTNLQEYLGNTDPQDANSRPLIPQVTQMTNGHFMVSWRSIGGVRYRVQYGNGGTNGSFNSTFTDILRPASAEIDPAALGTPATMTFTDDFTLTGGAPVNGRRYYRVTIVR